MLDAQALADNIMATLWADNDASPRTVQSKASMLGISDIGNCREYVRHMIVETEQDDQTGRNMFPAWWGHAIEQYVVPRLTGPIVEHVVKDTIEYDVTEKGHIVNVVGMQVTLPSGKKLPGSPDLVLAPQNTLLDIKTVDGMTWVRREGASLQQRFQRRMYTAALIQYGMLTDDEPVYCGNVWFDRSANEEAPHVEIEQYDEAMLIEIDDWLSDVDYAVLNNEEASWDKPFEWCQKACPFFMSCRGRTGLLGSDGWIDDPDGTVDKAAAMYAEGSALMKEGKALQREGKGHLVGTSGRTEGYTITSTYINESEVPGYQRAGYDRVSVRPAKKETE